MAKGGQPAVAASGRDVDDDGVRLPAGEVHGWEMGANQTVCGLSLSRSGLYRFGHVRWADVQPDTGGSADLVQRVCPRCAAAAAPRGVGRRRWQRVSPRP